jgi:hypothetical protein
MTADAKDAKATTELEDEDELELNKETLEDLDPDEETSGVRGGQRNVDCTAYNTGCSI